MRTGEEGNANLLSHEKPIIVPDDDGFSIFFGVWRGNVPFRYTPLSCLCIMQEGKKSSLSLPLPKPKSIVFSFVCACGPFGERQAGIRLGALYIGTTEII